MSQFVLIFPIASLQNSCYFSNLFQLPVPFSSLLINRVTHISLHNGDGFPKSQKKKKKKSCLEKDYLKWHQIIETKAVTCLVFYYWLKAGENKLTYFQVKSWSPKEQPPPMNMGWNDNNISSTLKFDINETKYFGYFFKYQSLLHWGKLKYHLVWHQSFFKNISIFYIHRNLRDLTNDSSVLPDC